MKGIHPYKGDGGIPVANEEDKGKLTRLHGEPVHVLPDALVDGEQTALSPDLSSRVTPRQVNAVQSELTSLFEGLVSAAEKQSGDDSALKWDVSGVQNLKAAVTEYTDAVADAVAAAAGTGGGGGGGGTDPALVARVTTLETRATAIEAVDTTQNTRLNALEASSTNHETRLVSLESSGGGGGGTGPALEARVTVLETKATALETHDAGQDTRLDALETRADGVDSEINDIDSRLLYVESEVGNNKTRIVDLEGVSDIHDDRLDALETHNAGQDARLNGLDARADGFDADIAGHETRLDDIDDKIFDIETKATYLKSDVEDHETRLVALETSGGGADPALEARVTALETHDATQDTRLSSIEAALSNPPPVPIEKILSYDRHIAATPDDTYYVNPTLGVDPTSDEYSTLLRGHASSPYKTVQGAIDHISWMYAGRPQGLSRTVRIRLAAGVYSGFYIYPSGISAWSIDSTVTGVTINSPCVVDNAKVAIRGVTIAPAAGDGIIAASGADVLINACKIKPSSGRSGVIARGGWVNMRGLIEVYTDLSYKGHSALYATGNGVLRVGLVDSSTPAPCDLHITGAWVNILSGAAGGCISVWPHVHIGTNPVGGHKYSVTSNAVVDSSGRTPAQLPGNQAGIARGGGQFV